MAMVLWVVSFNGVRSCCAFWSCCVAVRGGFEGFAWWGVGVCVGCGVWGAGGGFWWVCWGFRGSCGGWGGGGWCWGGGGGGGCGWWEWCGCWWGGRWFGFL